ncbi:MAG: stage V sporulation protein AC [Ruminococcus sp.]|nr:stage V sporulation protein AC [Candidatus Apopatosoma intestinale]
MRSEEYQKYVNSRAGKSPLLKDCLFAFLVGGLICALAEGLHYAYDALGIETETAKALVSVTLVFLAALFTGIGLFDDLAKVAGAGTLVPITGFANAVVSPAIDNKSEGFIMGVGAKMFVIAGPVIVYGILSSAIYGVVYYILNMWMG